jgi:hypothetical protein
VEGGDGVGLYGCGCLAALVMMHPWISELSATVWKGEGNPRHRHATLACIRVPAFLGYCNKLSPESHGRFTLIKHNFYFMHGLLVLVPKRDRRYQNSFYTALRIVRQDNAGNIRTRIVHIE